MNPFGQVQAVTFDAGGTLIEPWPSVGDVYAEVAARTGLKGLSVATLNRQFTAAWRAQKNFNYTRTAWAGIVDKTFNGLTEVPPSQTFFPELYSQFARPEAWRIFDDVIPTLEELASSGVKVGVISNWDERLRPLLQDLKLDSYFDAIIVSCETGFAKPSPVVFEQAAEKLALPPERVLHVGDDLELDVRGAQRAGMQGLLLQRAKGATDGQLQSLSDLLALLLHKKE